jgi:hypothetical protein
VVVEHMGIEAEVEGGRDREPPGIRCGLARASRGSANMRTTAADAERNQAEGLNERRAKLTNKRMTSIGGKIPAERRPETLPPPSAESSRVPAAARRSVFGRIVN